MSDLSLSIRSNTKVSRIGASLTPEHFGEVVGNPEKLAHFGDEVMFFYDQAEKADIQIGVARTLAGAYIHRVRTVQEKSTTSIAAELGAYRGKPVAPSTVTRYGYIAQLAIDFSFSPDDPEWPVLTNVLVDEKVLKDVLKVAKRQRAHPDKVAEGEHLIQRSDILAVVEEWSKPKPEVTASVGGSEAEGTNGVETTGDQSSVITTEGQRNGSESRETPVQKIPANNSGILDHIDTLIANLADVSAAEYDRCEMAREALERVMNASSHRAAGQKRITKRLERDAALAENEAAKAEAEAATAAAVAEAAQEK